ncbi:MAG TPA: hypothetical protein VF251_14150, partial [Pyrinomonadaceae bacterium]
SSCALYRHIGTDRLWVDWLLKSKRVTDRLEETQPKPLASAKFDHTEYLVQIGSDGLPERRPADLLASRACLIPVPSNIAALQQHNPEAAVAWRETTRSAFFDAFAAGYVVDDFWLSRKDDEQMGCYLLIPANKNELD